MRRHRLLSLIFVLYYIAIYKYVFCATCDGLKSITSINLKLPDAYVDDKEQIVITRNPRGVGSHRHLRVGDAHQVANYFLTGGPQKGHAHFVRETNCETNDNENNTTSTIKNKNQDDTDVPENQNNSNTESDPVVGAPRVRTEHSDENIIESLFRPTIDSLSRIPHTLGNELLTSILHPNLHPHINALHKIPGNLMKTATEPVVSLIRARAELRKALQRSLRKKNSIYPPIVGMAPRKFRNTAPSSNTIYPHFLLPHPPPLGYIVKYVPHNKPTIPSSEVVNTEQSSNYINDNLNTEENIESSINEDEFIGEEQGGNYSEQ